MTTVYQHSQLDGFRTAGMKNSFDRRADRTPGIDDIIHQDDGFSGWIAGDFRPAGFRKVAQLCQIVPV